jgi:arsenite-transporting ATPase
VSAGEGIPVPPRPPIPSQPLSARPELDPDGSDAPAPGGRRRYRFFAGKGGVGKTTCAAAWAVTAADAGAAVLAVSTDPAHSLGDALDQPLGPEPSPVALPAVAGGLPGGSLHAAEVAAAAAYRRWLDERRRALLALVERGTLLEAADLDEILALPLPGADELLGLLEVMRLADTAGADLVVVDTAPTGHTLRLLAAPGVLRRLAALLAAAGERDRVLAEAFGGRPGNGGEVTARLEADARALDELLRDTGRCAFTWVTTAEALAVAETADGLAALAALGVPVAELVINRLGGGGAPEREALAELARLAPDVPWRAVPELAEEPRGIAGLRRLGRELRRPAAAAPTPAPGGGVGPPRLAAPAPGATPPWMGDLLPEGLALVFVGGKGGVGKTTCAAALALLAAEARPGRPVHLLSTDPAHSLADVLNLPLGDGPTPVPGAGGELTAREIDATAAWGSVRCRLEEALDDVLAWGGDRGGAAATLDRAVLARLLEAVPPGVDELVALAELAEAVAATTPGPAPLHVVDTAPTGHALRLLELPALALAWDHALMRVLLRYRRVVRLGRAAEELMAFARRLEALRGLLARGDRCRFLMVTRGGELPRRETARLGRALAALGVAVGGLIVNAGGPEGGDAPGGWDILHTPAELPPPQGVASLLAWGRRWERRRAPHLP